MDTIAFLLALSSAVVLACTHAVFIRAQHMDGAFQTSSMLFRLASGNMPGRDFLPYLGLGPLFMLFPGYLLMGRTVVAADGDAYLMSFMVYAASATLIYALVFSERSYWRLIRVFAVSICLVDVISNVQDLGPRNSLRPLRSSVAYLAVGLMLIVMCHVPARTLRYVLYGAIAGLAAIWSNDYGLPTFVVLLALAFYEAWTRRESLLNWLLCLFAALLTGVVLFTLLTAGHPGALLHYNFYDVASDQYWYFGNEPRINKIIALADLHPLMWTTAFILLATAMLLFKRNRRYVALVAIGWALYMGGSVAILGGHFDEGYYYAFHIWQILLVSLMLLSRASQLRLLLSRKFAGPRSSVFILICTLILLTIACVGYGKRVNSDWNPATPDPRRQLPQKNFA
jgi:hypothetical protein